MLISFGVLYGVFHVIDACISLVLRGINLFHVVTFSFVLSTAPSAAPSFGFVHFDRNNALVSLPVEIGALNRLGIFDLHSNQVITYSSSSIHKVILIIMPKYFSEKKNLKILAVP